MSDGGKGSAPRPFSVSHDEWSTRWDVIFGRDKLSKEIEREKEAQKEQDKNKEVSS